MNTFNNFSYKIFSIITALFCFTIYGSALADTIGQASYAPRIKIDETNTIFTVSELSGNTKILKLCSGGYYLSRCGSKTVGTNWLKGIYEQTSDTTFLSSEDYFSYETNTSSTTNIENLRKFFAGVEQISYRSEDGNIKTVLPNGNGDEDEGYLYARNLILSNLCITENGELTDIECKRCPNNADISESTVEQNLSDGKIVWDSWRVHPITDCYMTEFSDNTGTYVYVPNNASNSAAQRCYYSNNIEGDSLK